MSEVNSTSHTTDNKITTRRRNEIDDLGAIAPVVEQIDEVTRRIEQHLEQHRPDTAVTTPKPTRTAKPVGIKPAKPYPDFPLYAHSAGYWAKKIRGRFHYFGSWQEPDAALTKYLEQKDDLHAGRVPKARHEAFMVWDAVNAFLNHKKSLVESGELKQRTWDGYKEVTDIIVKVFGKRRRVADLGPDDFATLRNKLGARFGLVRLGNMIQVIRSVFKFAFDADRIDRPMRFGPTFKRPSKKVMRLHRAKKGPMMFTAEEVRSMIDEAGPQLKAMILLGINAGLGCSDCARLPLTAINLDTGWTDYPREKTGINRRFWLWSETVEAIKDVLEQRPEPKDKADADLIFITLTGRQAWVQTGITHETTKLLKKLGIDGHRNFYALRHTFRTVADGSLDQVACNTVMGHADNSMADNYREQLPSDNRLKAVAEHVRNWLYKDAKLENEQPDVISMRERTAAG